MRRSPQSQLDADRGLLAATFDLESTLIHAPDRVEIYRQVLARHGITVAAGDLRRELGWVWKELSCLADPRRDRFRSHSGGARGWWYRFLVRVCERLEVTEPSRFAGAELFHRFTRAESWRVYPDVIPTLEALRAAGLRLGLISNWDERLPHLLEDLGLMGYFDAVEFSSGCGCEKPHPRIFERCLKRLGVPPARALHLGASALEDVEGALALGMRALHIERRAHGKPHLQALIAPFVDPPLADGQASQ